MTLLGVEDPLLIAGLDGDLGRPGQPTYALDDGDLVLLHQPLDAGVELPGDLARSLNDLAQVKGNIGRAQPVGVGVLHIMVDLARPQQRLGRDAAPVEADAAEPLALDDRDLEAELRGADRGDIAAGAAAEDGEVEGLAHASMPSGFSTNPLNALMNWAPTAPSIARWSKLPVALITVAITRALSTT